MLSYVIVKRSVLHGLGVFASTAIAQGKIIETCPLLRLEGLEWTNSNITDYLFGKNTLLLGFGSLYNHSSTPNAAQAMKEDMCVLTALSDIPQGQEILINYGRQWWSSRGLVPAQESVSALRSQFGEC